MKTIAVIGGVGKTTVALNLASSLHKRDKEVVIVDADLKTPHLGLFLDIALVPITLNNVLNGERNIDESTYIHKTGLKIIPSSIVLGESNADVSKLKKKIEDIKADFVIIDAANMSYETQEALKAADEAIIVTNPNHVSVADALRSITLAEENNATVIGVLLNKTGYFDMNTKSIEEILERPVIASIPENIYFKKALKMKMPFVNLFPKNKITKNFEELAGLIIG